VTPPVTTATTATTTATTATTVTTGTSVDGAVWLDRWDRQQEGFMGNREERFDTILDVVAVVCGTDHPNVLDLGCGPGSLAGRVLDRFPAATVVGLDNDPVLMTLGRRAYGDHDGRLTWVTADLRAREWVAAVQVLGPFDAVVSTTALHWLDGQVLIATYQAVKNLLVPGGVLANGDHLHEPEQLRLGKLQHALRRPADDEREGWLPWWEALEAAAAGDPELTAAFAERAARHATHPDTTDQPGLAAHVDALRAAGFGEVGTVWQVGDDRILVGLR